MTRRVKGSRQLKLAKVRREPAGPQQDIHPSADREDESPLNDEQAIELVAQRRCSPGDTVFANLAEFKTLLTVCKLICPSDHTFKLLRNL